MRWYYWASESDGEQERRDYGARSFPMWLLFNQWDVAMVGAVGSWNCRWLVASPSSGSPNATSATPVRRIAPGSPKPRRGPCRRRASTSSRRYTCANWAPKWVESLSLFYFPSQPFCPLWCRCPSCSFFFRSFRCPGSLRTGTALASVDSLIVADAPDNRHRLLWKTFDFYSFLSLRGFYLGSDRLTRFSWWLVVVGCGKRINRANNTILGAAENGWHRPDHQAVSAPSVGRVARFTRRRPAGVADGQRLDTVPRRPAAHPNTKVLFHVLQSTLRPSSALFQSDEMHFFLSRK